jgi:hypothetical protein
MCFRWNKKKIEMFFWQQKKNWTVKNIAANKFIEKNCSFILSKQNAV